MQKHTFKSTFIGNRNNIIATVFSLFFFVLGIFYAVKNYDLGYLWVSAFAIGLLVIIIRGVFVHRDDLNNGRSR